MKCRRFKIDRKASLVPWLLLCERNLGGSESYLTFTFSMISCFEASMSPE